MILNQKQGLIEFLSLGHVSSPTAPIKMHLKYLTTSIVLILVTAVNTGPVATGTTSASASCSTGQVVVSPSFFNYKDPASDPSPWVISHDSGSPGCVVDPSYVDAARDHYYGDGHSM